TPAELLPHHLVWEVLDRDGWRRVHQHEALVGTIDGDEVRPRDGPEVDRRALGEPARRRVEGSRNARDTETSVRRAGARGRRRAEVEVGQDGSAARIRRSV